MSRFKQGIDSRNKMIEDCEKSITDYLSPKYSLDEHILRMAAIDGVYGECSAVKLLKFGEINLWGVDKPLLITSGKYWKKLGKALAKKIARVANRHVLSSEILDELQRVSDKISVEAERRSRLLDGTKHNGQPKEANDG